MSNLNKAKLNKCAALLLIISVLGTGCIAFDPPLTKPEIAQLERERNACDEPATIISELKGVVILPNANAVRPEGWPGVEGVLVKGLDFLNTAEVQERLEIYFSQPLTEKDLPTLQAALVMLCRNADHPVVDVVLPEQEVAGGVIQLIVVVAKIGNVTIENEGEKYTPDEKVLKVFSLQRGDRIKASGMLASADWFNRHPFRSIGVGYQQGAIGESDVVLTVKDSKPWQFFSSYENTGTKSLGRNQISSGFNWALPYDRDQLLGYQYRADSHGTKLDAHTLSYQYLMPSRQYLQLTGSYSDVSAAVENLFPGLSQKGEYWLGSLRYGIPLASSATYKPEIQFGFEFKKEDSNLLYGGENVFSAPTETIQFIGGYSAEAYDRYGVNSIDLSATWSPGDLTNYNEDSDFTRAGRANSTADYYYLRGAWRRNTVLPKGYNWMTQIIGQFAPDKLPAGEQLGLGGYSTLRGYEERFTSGDSGVVIRNELYLPPVQPLKLFGYDLESDQLRILGFVDYGTIHLNKFESGDNSLDSAGKNFNLTSVGWGLRYRLRENLTFRLDHGFQLSEKERSGSNQQFHFSLGLSF